MKKKREQGQILMELIVAVTIIIFVSVSISLVIALSVRTTRQTMTKTKALFLSQGTVESVRAFTLEDWHNLDRLATSTNYFATTSAGKWVHATGTEAAVLDGITYTRYFRTAEAFRSTSTGNLVASGGAWDPGTIKITTRLTWTTAEGGADEFSQTAYVSRYTNAIYSQTDWSGGSAGEAVTSGATTTFATSTNIDFASTTGSIKIQPI